MEMTRAPLQNRGKTGMPFDKMDNDRRAKMKNILISLAVMLIGISTVVAQDAEGCKDHPLFSRMPDFYIEECAQNYDQLDFLNAAGEDITLEGTLTHIVYRFNSESANMEPSTFQIIKNYSNAVKVTPVAKGPVNQFTGPFHDLPGWKDKPHLCDASTPRITEHSYSRGPCERRLR